MYARLARLIAYHPRSILAGWGLVIVVCATIALWGFGTPLFDRLHSDLPQSQVSESYRGNKILMDNAAQAYTVIAAIDGVDLRQARREGAQREKELSAAREEAHAAGERARAFGQEAAAAARAGQMARAQTLTSQAEEARRNAEDAAARARDLSHEPLPGIDALAKALDGPLAGIESLEGVTAVASPVRPSIALIDERARDLVNPNGDKMAIAVTLDAAGADGALDAAGRARIARVETHLRDLQQAIEDALSHPITLRLTHADLIEKTSLKQLKDDLVTAESVGIPLSVVIMIFVFGGVAAALMPIGGALVAISTALAVMLGMTYVADQQSFAVNVISVLGLGLSIDYGLLIISRFREELARASRANGREIASDVQARLGERAFLLQPLEATMASAGRTVAFSAITVAVSILGMLVFTPDLLRSLGVAGLSVVLLAMCSALTGVPAIAFLAARHLMKVPRNPLVRLASKPATLRRDLTRTGWYRAGRLVNTHPWFFLAVSALILGMCVIPATHLQLRNSMIELLAADNPKRLVLEDFSDVPAVSVPAINVLADTEDTGPLSRWAETIANWDGVEGVTSPRIVADGYTAMSIEVEGEDRGSPQATSIVERLRENKPSEATFYVTGQAAQQRDFVDALEEGLPLSLGIIVGATLVLLFLMTRSLVVPIKALLINSLSLLAALGVSTWVFQDGHGVGLLGADKLGGLESYVVVMMVCIGFGLSMDYEVFLLARMREVYDATGDNDRAVVLGLTHSGRIITSAAGILVCVFVAFSMSKMVVLKQVGFVMATAVALDATIVRLALVPSLMTLFGAWNWWAPRWLLALVEGKGARTAAQSRDETGRPVA